MKQRFFLLGLFLISLIPLLGLFHQGLPITHDGQDHVARIANFYTNLQEGNIIPRWAANLNWGYGHPILMFLYPLPSYLTSLIHFFGFSFVDSVKIFFGLAFIASGLAMFMWLKEFLSKESAFVGALLYMFAPYRFIDLYVRGAIGEHAAFIFPPLILFFLYKLAKEPSYWFFLGGSLSLAGLILAHNAISLMFLPLVGLYALFLIWQSKKRKLLIIHSLLLIVFGFCLSAFFWAPAFMEGKYTLREIVTSGTVINRFVSFQQLIYGPWSYGGTGIFSVQIGLIHWLFVLLAIPLVIKLRSKKDKNWLFLFILLLAFFFTLFVMTSYSSFIWEKISVMQKFQFPWRFLSLSVFLSAVIGAFVFSAIPKTKQFFALTFAVLLILIFNKDYWHAKAYLQKPEIFYTGIYKSTTDTGESAPIWSVRFMEKEPKAHIEIIEGKGILKELDRTTTRHSYSLTADNKVRVRENTLYFPGWEVLVDGKPTAVEFQDQNNRGLMTFFVEKGMHEVVIEFHETKLRWLANLLSLVSLFVLGLLGILKKRLWLN